MRRLDDARAFPVIMPVTSASFNKGLLRTTRWIRPMPSRSVSHLSVSLVVTLFLALLSSLLSAIAASFFFSFLPFFSQSLYASLLCSLSCRSSAECAKQGALLATRQADEVRLQCFNPKGHPIRTSTMRIAAEPEALLHEHLPRFEN